MKRVLLLSLALAVLFVGYCGSASSAAPASDVNWPTGPINLIIPGSPGGGTDIPARTIASFLEKALNTTILPENMSTAGGSVCYNYVADAAPDGYTMGYVTVPAFTMTYVQGTLRSNPKEKFEYVGQLIQSTIALCVGKDSPYKTFEELAEYVKANPDMISYAGTGAASSDTLTANALAIEHGLKMRVVNYEGDNDVIVALMSGQCDIACVNAINLPEYTKSGDVVPLVLLNVERSDMLPGIPTLGELGYPIPLNGTFQGIVLPKGVDPAILAKVRSAFDAVVKAPDFLAAAKSANLSIEYHTAEEFYTKVSDVQDFLGTLNY